MMNDEKKLINRCKKGDNNAQKVIFEKFSPVMYAICLRYLKDKAVADDIMQEGFYIVFTKIKQFKGTGSFEGWIKRIMINLSLKHLKKRSKNHFYEVTEIEQYTDLQSIRSNEETKINFDDEKSVVTNTEFTQDEIFDAISQLPEGFRTVFNLYAIEGYKHKEIAEILEISINTSKTQLLRARKQLQYKLYKLALKKHNAKNLEFYKEVI